MQIVDLEQDKFILYSSIYVQSLKSWDNKTTFYLIMTKSQIWNWKLWNSAIFNKKIAKKFCALKILVHGKKVL